MGERGGIAEMGVGDVEKWNWSMKERRVKRGNNCAEK